jgi:hypothetical protein
VLCPPMPTVAFPHDHSPLFARVLDIEGAKVPYFDQSVWSAPAINAALLAAAPRRLAWPKVGSRSSGCHFAGAGIDRERAAGDDGTDWPHRQRVCR